MILYRCSYTKYSHRIISITYIHLYPKYIGYPIGSKAFPWRFPWRFETPRFRQVRCVQLVQSRWESGRCCDPADELGLQRWNGSRPQNMKTWGDYHWYLSIYIIHVYIYIYITYIVHVYIYIYIHRYNSSISISISISIYIYLGKL